MFEEPYTLFAAFIGSTLVTMATHGTDQDSVQRMLTAPNYRKSQLSLILSGVMDFPIAMAFLTVGILLSVYYSVVPGATMPAADNEIFGHYIVHEMPVVFRGLVIAGVFATMMGSTSAALNALATSFTKDFYLPYIRRDATDRQAIRAVKWATVWFSVLMIIVACTTAYLVIVHPNVRIIPIVLGIFGYTYGSLLGVFFAGMLDEESGQRFWEHSRHDPRLRGRGDPERIAQWRCENLRNDPLSPAPWLPVMEFPWWIFFGTIVTFLVAILFKSRPHVRPTAG